jgi:prevent-host-death family protein
LTNIKPAAAIRKNYNQIAELCRQTGEPVYLTKNGEGDLVVMDVESFARRESLIRLKEKLLQSELDIRKGRSYSVEETVADKRRAVAEVADSRKSKQYTIAA